MHTHVLPPCLCGPAASPSCISNSAHLMQGQAVHVKQGYQHVRHDLAPIQEAGLLADPAAGAQMQAGGG